MHTSTFQFRSDARVDVIFLTTAPSPIAGQRETAVHGTQLLFSQQEKAGYSYVIRPPGVDLLLAIDYRPNYRSLCSVLPRTPLIVWVRDPRPPEDVEKIKTLRIPGAANIQPQGIAPLDCTSLAAIVRASHRVHRPILFASPAPFLAGKVAGAYGVGVAEVHFLPNIIDLDVAEAVKSESPRVVFLGRLCQDPGGLVSQFGVYVGRWDGSGMEGIPHFAEGLHRLLSDSAMRARLGKEGRRWVTDTHNRSAFLLAFNTLCARMGVPARHEAATPATHSSPSKQRSVCIVTPYQEVYSQTFVRDHIKRLPTKVKVLDSADLRSGKDVLKQTLCESNVEAVLAEFGPTGVAVLEVTSQLNIPLIVHFHGYDAYVHRVLEQYSQSYPTLFRHAAAIIAVSRDMERQLLRLGAPRQKLHYNPCGVDTSIFHGGDPACAPPHFIAVSRFVAKKAPHLTLRAFKHVVEALPEARLSMIGDGPLWEACKQLARELGIAEQVKFLGPCAHETVAVAMRQARAFVQHSICAGDGDTEGTPLAVMEAGATGLPVVATRHPGIQDVVIHHQTGFLVDEGDVEGMAAHMLRLGRDGVLAARLGRTARERICAEFSMEQRITTLWHIIEATMLAR